MARKRVRFQVPQKEARLNEHVVEVERTVRHLQNTNTPSADPWENSHRKPPINVMFWTSLLVCILMFSLWMCLSVGFTTEAASAPFPETPIPSPRETKFVERSKWKPATTTTRLLDFDTTYDNFLEREDRFDYEYDDDELNKNSGMDGSEAFDNTLEDVWDFMETLQAN